MNWVLSIAKANGDITWFYSIYFKFLVGTINSVLYIIVAFAYIHTGVRDDDIYTSRLWPVTGAGPMLRWYMLKLWPMPRPQGLLRSPGSLFEMSERNNSHHVSRLLDVWANIFCFSHLNHIGSGEGVPSFRSGFGIFGRVRPTNKCEDEQNGVRTNYVLHVTCICLLC